MRLFILRLFRLMHSPFVRNRPILRSPVMARWDAMFADRARNAEIYAAILADPAEPLTADYLREVFARHSPDGPLQQGAASSEDVVTHVFEHILGPNSWWGAKGATWRGGELFTAAYRDAISRAQAAGNIPITTFQLQASPDDGLQLHVLETSEVVMVLIATPPVPTGVSARKAAPPPGDTYSPIDPAMPQVSSYTQETLGR